MPRGGANRDTRVPSGDGPGPVRARKDGSTKVLTTTQRFAESFGIDSVSRKKIKGFIKDRALFSSAEKKSLEDFAEPITEKEEVVQENEAPPQEEEVQAEETPQE